MHPADLPPHVLSPSDGGLTTSLDRLHDGQTAVVRSLQCTQPEWSRQLADLGFLPGEPVQLMHRAPLFRDPLVVRVGHSTFALRVAEAACVLVDTGGGAR